MIPVTFYNFGKKHNSTKVPSSGGTVYNCALKEECSILSPVLRVAFQGNNGPTSFNYAMIAAFSRYYFITDWQWAGGNAWWAFLSVDTLASFKTAILNSTVYVARSSVRSNPLIIDGYYPATASTLQNKIEYWSQNASTPWVYNYDNGMYIVGVINGDSSSVGAVSYYAMTPAQFAVFKGVLMGSTTWAGQQDDISDDLYKSLFNPFQYVASVNWFPMAYNANWGTSISSLKLGWWTLSGVSCYLLSVKHTTITKYMNVYEHPQAARGSYLNASPFTKFRLCAPPWGEFTLDNSLLLASTWHSVSGQPKYCNVHLVLDIDFISGQGDLYVYAIPTNDANALLLLAHSQTAVCVPMQIAQINSNAWGQVRNTHDMEWGIAGAAAKTLGGALSLNAGAVAGGIMEAGQTYDNYILNGIENKVPHVQERGNNGSITGFMLPFFIECDYMQMVADDNADRGRPLCEAVLLSTLNNGFIQCVDAHIVATTATENEINNINVMLNGGAYLE